MSPKVLIRYAASLVVAALLMGWVLRDVSPQELWQQLLRVSPPLLGLSVALAIGHNVFRVWRWRALLAPVRPGVPFRPMFAAVIVGYMTSWVVPGRLGELVRPMLLAGKERLPLGPCVGTVVADRLLDGCAVLVFFVIGVWITPLPEAAAEHVATIRTFGAIAVAAVAAVLLVLSALTVREATIGRWLERRGRVVGWLGRAALSLAQGVRALHSPRLFVVIVVQTALAWTTIVFSIWFGLKAAGVQVPLGVVMFMQPLLALGVAIPTPGGAGSYHAALNFGLTLFGVDWNVAAAAGLVLHASITIPIILLGLLLLATEGISFRDVVQGAQQLRELGGAPGATPVEPLRRRAERPSSLKGEESLP